ncbi:N-acetylglucosamine-6-phosphate deacetylase [Clostridiales bacterium COT073_COT-073]|nr:N-acetylglucosamine-6-phosphate deacetylase [Clostridiales bacterium COT073_COT-073]
MQDKGFTSDKNVVFYGRDVFTKRSLAITVNGELISSIKEIPDDSSLPWVSAGWIDLQVNGCFGYDFNSIEISASDVVNAASKLHTCGVTQFLPTIITGSRERMAAGMAAVNKACQADYLTAATIPGIHMEGPWISDQEGPRGAHKLEYIKDGSIEEFEYFQQAAGGRIIEVTLAPERNGAITLTEELVRRGICVAIGHCNASRSQILAIVDAGASISTHLGNGSHPTLPRHHNYIWEQMAEDRLYAGLIADGHHLPLAVLTSILRCKKEKAFVVSDCVSLAGLPPGEYFNEIGNVVILNEDGRLFTKENPEILAGSSATLLRNIEFLTSILGLSLAEVIRLVTERPAAAMGWAGMGSLAVNKQAYMTFFDYDMTVGKVKIRRTVVAGQSVYEAQNQIT